MANVLDTLYLYNTCVMLILILHILWNWWTMILMINNLIRHIPNNAHNMYTKPLVLVWISIKKSYEAFAIISLCKQVTCLQSQFLLSHIEKHLFPILFSQQDKFFLSKFILVLPLINLCLHFLILFMKPTISWSHNITWHTRVTRRHIQAS